ncbi:hypothetical protein [Streptomyces sp. NPDC002690]
MPEGRPTGRRAGLRAQVPEPATATVTQLLDLVGSIAPATEHHSDGATETDRLLILVIDIDGVRRR